MSDVDRSEPRPHGERRTYLQARRAAGKPPAVAALPIEHPREFATALDRVTVELWGPPGLAPRASQAWLPSFTCPLTRNALEWLLRGEVAAAADLLVVPHTCDSLQALATQIIDLGAGGLPALTFYHPRTLDAAARGAFLRDELRRYRAALEARLGPIPEDALRDAVARHREADRLARRLLDEGPREGLTEVARYALLRRREWTAVDDQLADLRAALERPAVPPAPRSLPVVLSGILPEPPGLLEQLEQLGLRIAFDDLAGLGRRLPARLPEPTGDPLEDLARRWEALPPCSTRTSALAARTDHLEAGARRAGARGAVFVIVARCEPELFDLVAVRERLRDAGVPSVVVETELEASLPAALGNRLEAFAESLQGAVTAPVAAAPSRRPVAERPAQRRPARVVRHLAEARLAGRVVLGYQALKRWNRLRTRPAEPPFGPPLHSSVALRGLIEQYYLEGRSADGARPVAWITSGAPVELLRPLGYYVVYPENHAAICGARKTAQTACEAAESGGYSRALCSYARTDFGTLFSGRTPVGRIPKPDLLVTCSNICQTVVGWYRVLSRETGAPLVVIDTPFLQGGLLEHQTAYVHRQLEELAAVAERVAGRTLRPAALERTVSLAQEASFLWGECLGTARARPSPWFGLEAFVHMAPIVVLRGTEAAVRYYSRLAGELRERVERGVAGLEGERCRLLWDNLPVWPELKRLTELLAAHRANFVAATYTHAWSDCADLFAARDPLQGLAQTYASVLLNRDLRERSAGMAALARRFHADGAVFHADRNCRPYSLGEHGLRDHLARQHGVPGLVVEADHNDPRDVAWEATANRLEAFLESLTPGGARG